MIDLGSASRSVAGGFRIAEISGGPKMRVEPIAAAFFWRKHHEDFRFLGYRIDSATILQKTDCILHDECQVKLQKNLTILPVKVILTAMIQKREGQRSGQTSIAGALRRRIEAEGERYWRAADFAGASAGAVSQALSRLTKKGVVTRAGKGLYYHSRQTVFGPSKPSQSDILAHTLHAKIHPAGRTAANLLGFTTQNPARGEYATSANRIDPAALRGPAKIYTRRPESWDHMSDADAALLDFLRSRGVFSDLTPEATRRRLFGLLMESGRFERLAEAAKDEPPRVRAILGAIGQELGMREEALKTLREQINPLSRFDFGALRGLRHAREWQAK